MRRIALILPFLALAACGVAGDPRHPDEQKSFSQSLTFGLGAGL